MNQEFLSFLGDRNDFKIYENPNSSKEKKLCSYHKKKYPSSPYIKIHKIIKFGTCEE